MKGSWKALGFVATLALVAYFAWFAAHAFDVEALKALRYPRVAAAMLLAVLLYATIIPVSAFAWQRLLRQQGESWRTRELARMMGLTQLAKYIPGNVAQLVSRAALALRAGMNSRVYAISLLQESVLAVAASLIVGFGMLALSASGLAQLPYAARGPVVVLGITSAVVVLVLCSFELPARELRAHRRWWVRAIGHAGGLPGAAVGLPALAAYCINFLVIGLAIWIIAQALQLPTSVDFAMLTAAFALSWTLGYLAPGAPAGIGVRDATMLLLMGSVAADAQLLLLVLLVRIMTTLGDGVCFVVAWLGARNAEITRTAKP
jgi:uncharacterized membrane protein YbhN (UPF0104 family)